MERRSCLSKTSQADESAVGDIRRLQVFAAKDPRHTWERGVLGHFNRGLFLYLNALNRHSSRVKGKNSNLRLCWKCPRTPPPPCVWAHMCVTESAAPELFCNWRNIRAWYIQMAAARFSFEVLELFYGSISQEENRRLIRPIEPKRARISNWLRNNFY